MKKLLIATTALVATAGVAAAEVKVTGDGRMGVTYGLGALGNDDLQFASRIRVKFTLTGETDGGLSFGGDFMANDAGGTGSAADGAKGQIFISGAFGRLAMGDVKGAAETVVGDLPEVGFQDLSSQFPAMAPLPANVFNIGQNEVAYLTGDGGAFETVASGNPGALYTYTTGGLTFALGLNDGHHTNTIFGTTVVDMQQYSLGVKYAFGDYSVALGYEVADFDGAKATHLVLGGTAKFGDTTVQAMYGQGGEDFDGFKQYGLGVTSKFDAVTVKGYVKKTEIEDFDVMSWGLGAEYALGGGATLAGGIADNDYTSPAGVSSKVVADFGIKFTF